MLKYMEELSPGEASNIKKTIQDLFKQTCILQVKCDPVTLVRGIIPDTEPVPITENL